MMTKKRTPRTNGIAKISIEGYKSIADRTELEIRNLTVLSGANSSGKSSFMQPILLMKQTLDASYDPGPLLLNGPNAKFTATEQLFSKIAKLPAEFMRFGVATTQEHSAVLEFRKAKQGVSLSRMDFSMEPGTIGSITPKTTHEELSKILPQNTLHFFARLAESQPDMHWSVARERCFLNPVIESTASNTTYSFPSTPATAISNYIRNLIHLPGLRGNPERSYPVTAVDSSFPGTFQDYAASVIVNWQAEKKDELERLSEDLERLGLTWRVRAVPINDTQVEVLVGRLRHKGSGKADLVNIADVGLGLSQTLPVLLALHVAHPGQVVYLEQPEIHLHPIAQSEIAHCLANAANRGVRVIVETHSSLVLLGIQALIAEGKLSPERVKLHWFSRDLLGKTRVESADLDETGTFGEWPEDFDKVSLDAQSRFLDASEARQIKKLKETLQ